MVKKFLAVCFVCIALASSALAADTAFFFHGGDRVVFLGDSITEQQLYTTYVEAYTVTRFPKQRFGFWNSGWGGDTSWLRMRSHTDEAALFAAQADEQQKMVEKAVDACLSRDVLSFKPTVVTVNFGMNDHNYEPFREDIFRAYVRSQTEIVKVLAKNGVRVVLLTPQPIEERRPDPDKDPRNESLRKFSNGLKDVAAKQGALFVDQFNPYMAIMMREHDGGRSDDLGPKGFSQGNEPISKADQIV
jgi:lysophospholipase L1-like esterase